MLGKTKPFLETVFINLTDFGTKISCQDTESAITFVDFLEELFQCIKNLKYFNFHMMFKILKRIMITIMILSTPLHHRKCICFANCEFPKWNLLLGKIKGNEQFFAWVMETFGTEGLSPYIKWLMLKFSAIEEKKHVRYCYMKTYVRTKNSPEISQKIKLKWKRQVQNEDNKIRSLLKTLLGGRMRTSLKTELFSDLEQNSGLWKSEFED